jgi:hypothetical protein
VLVKKYFRGIARFFRGASENLKKKHVGPKYIRSLSGTVLFTIVQVPTIVHKSLFEPVIEMIRVYKYRL